MSASGLLLIAFAALAVLLARRAWRPPAGDDPGETPDEHGPNSPDRVTVLRSSDPLVIQMVKDALAKSDIPADVLDEHSSSIFGSLPSIAARVVVPVEFAEQAAQIVRDLNTTG